jgi:hypothetical protein
MYIYSRNPIILQRYLSSDTLFLTGMLFLLTGITLGNSIMSIAVVLLVLWWVWVSFHNGIGKFSHYFSAIGFFLIALMPLAGFAYEGNPELVLKDFNGKLPLLLLPLPLLSPHKKNISDKIWVGMILSGIALAALAGAIEFSSSQETYNPRKWSPFISNVRMGTLCALLVIWILWKHIVPAKKTISERIGWGGIVAFIMAYLLLLQSITGLFLILAFAPLLTVLFLFRFQRLIAIQILTISFLSISGIFLIARQEWKLVNGKLPFHKGYDSGPQFNEEGFPIKYDLFPLERENGFLIGANVSPGSLQKAWPQKSNIPLHGKTLNGESMFITLLRYMSSRGLKKDAFGLAQLSDAEVRAIENGCVNQLGLIRPGLYFRLNQMFKYLAFYLETGDPGKESLTLKLELWRCYYSQFENYFWFGKGHEAIPFNENSPPPISCRLEAGFNSFWPHQQWLTIGLRFGVVGLLFFAIAWFWPLYFSKYRSIAFPLVFFTLTMCFEDSLETQAGITQVAVVCLLVLGNSIRLHQN